MFNRLLGHNHGAATQQLQRMLLFRFVKEAGRDLCFRCGERIDFDSFSLDHMQPWRSAVDPQASFFDLENIAFSHLRCNTGAAKSVNAAKTHCPQGHPYSGDNLYIHGGRRLCLTCRAVRDQERYQLKVAGA